MRCITNAQAPSGCGLVLVVGVQSAQVVLAHAQDLTGDVLEFLHDYVSFPAGPLL